MTLDTSRSTSRLSCPICGNNEFDEQDGGYFCTECATQSQDFHVQETEEASFQNTTFYQKRLPSRKAQESDPHTKDSNLGRPWTIYEAYQYIILAQVDALIAQGASPHLKDVVYSIWANYLRKLGVAFCQKEKLVPDIVLQSGEYRQRELNRGSSLNPRSKNKRLHVKTTKAAEEVEDESEEEYLGIDGPVFNLIKEGQQLFKGKKENRRRKANRSPEWMNLEKTITICYIGLMITDPLILPHDVIRWIYEGKVPFLCTTHVLPKDIVLSDMDHNLFKISTFTSQQLRMELSKMLEYMSLETIPQVGVDKLITRFVDQLCLPGDFKSSCLRLAKTFPYYFYGNSTVALSYKTDIMALAYVITALNLALGLDGDTESQLSDCTRKLQHLIGSEPPLFVWEDWRQATADRFHCHFDGCTQFTQPFHNSELRHLTSYVRCYHQIGKGQAKHTKSALNWHMNLFRRYTKEFKDGLMSPLELALERSGIQETADEEDRKAEERLERLQSFKECTICHITDPDTFSLRYREEVYSGGDDARTLLDFFKTRPKTCMLAKPPDGARKLSTKQEDSIENQSQPVSWLIKLCSQIVGCKPFQLNHAVEGVQECVWLKTSGQCQDDLVVSSQGVRPQGKRVKAKIKRMQKASTTGAR